MAGEFFKYPFLNGCQNLPKDKDADLREIKKWLETQPQLPKFNDEYLHLFLHSNYYNLEETKSNVEAYFSLRSTAPEIFSNRSLSNSKLRTALNNHFFGMVPKRTPEGYQVVCIALNEKKLQDYNYADAVKATFILFDIVTSESGLCPGYIFIYDSKAVTTSIALKFNFSILKKQAQYFQEAAPVRVKNIICVNSVSFVHYLYSVFRPILRSSLIDKLHIFGTNSDLTSFYEKVPRECVFEEYGGTAGSIEAAHETFMELLETKYSEWIEDESIYAVEEKEKESKSAKRSFFSFW